jgi:hypothetical protein
MRVFDPGRLGNASDVHVRVRVLPVIAADAARMPSGYDVEMDNNSPLIQALRVFGYGLLGLVVGAIAGLVLLPMVVAVFVGPERELRAWDGQNIGSIVGLMIGLFVVLRKYGRRS